MGLTRLGSIAALAAVVLVAWHGAADAAPTELTFFPTHVPVVFQAGGSGGSTANIEVLVARSELLTAQGLAGLPLPAPPEGQTYFEVLLQPQDPTNGAPFVPLTIPKSAATLITTAGSVAAVGFDPSPGSLNADWVFPVPDSITQATLDIAQSTVTSYGGDGSQESFTIAPATIDFTTQGPGSVPIPVPGGAQGGAEPRPITASTGTAESGTTAGIVLGGLLAIGLGAAAAVSIARRRAFHRADREGRVVLVGPPSLSAAAMAARLTGLEAAGAAGRERHGIFVKLLGWLEIEGTRQPITAGPLQELICFLVLNPGRSFTSVQIRESVWGLGRQPITSGAFRNYMVALRKAFGPGVVVTERFRYELTDAVISDWDLFRGHLEADDELAGADSALALVRGPVLHGSFDGKKNSPFAWVVGTANDIEDRVVTTSDALAHAYLALGEAANAARAVAQGLLCADSNLALRRIDLEVGAALGGAQELGRRLEAARAAMATFPSDVDELESFAVDLGWEAVTPG